MKANQKLNIEGVEVILFPQSVLNLTQGFDNSRTWLSHEGTFALDNAGKAPIYAPVSMMCMGRYNLSNGNELLLQSLEKVLFADGSKDYLTLDIWHSDDVSKIKIGSIFRQGELICMSGNNGIGNGGEHLHIECGKGKPTKVAGSTPLVYSKGVTHFESNNFHPGTLPNAIDPRNVFHMNDTMIQNTFGMSFKIYESNRNGWEFNEKLKEQTYLENGVIVKSKWIWDKEYQSWYYLKSDGRMARKEWVADKNKCYYVLESGKMATNTILALTVKFDKNGVATK